MDYANGLLTPAHNPPFSPFKKGGVNYLLPLIKGGEEGLYKLFSNPKFILWIMLNSLYNKNNGSDGPMGEGRNG